MKKKRCKMLSIVLSMMMISMSLLSGCGSTNSNNKENSNSSKKIEITDLAGRKVTFDKVAKKAVVQWSGSGGGFMTISALAGKDVSNIIVGMDAGLKNYRLDMWNQFKKDIPELEKIPDIGSIDDDTFNTELAISQGAEVAFFPMDLKKTAQQSVQPKLEAAGIQVVYTDYHSEDLEKHKQTISIMGKILGYEDRANEIIDYYNKKVTAVYDRIDKIKSKKPSVYIEVGMGGPKEYGNSFGDYSWGMLAKKCGADLITDGVIKEAEPINPELLLTKDPDIIMITGSYWPEKSNSMRLGFDANEKDSQKLLKAFTKRDGWSNLKAVKNKEVYSMHHAISREVYDCAVIEYLAKTFYPDEFKDTDPEATLKEFYEKFLPYEFGGLWFTKLK